MNIPILNDGQAQHVSAKDQAKASATIFSQECQVNDPYQPPQVVSIITVASFQPIRFTPRDIKKWLRALDTAKAAGSDHIPAVVLKTCAPELAVPLPKFLCPPTAPKQPQLKSGTTVGLWHGALFIDVVTSLCPEACSTDIIIIFQSFLLASVPIPALSPQYPWPSSSSSISSMMASASTCLEVAHSSISLPHLSSLVFVLLDCWLNIKSWISCNILQLNIGKTKATILAPGPDFISLRPNMCSSLATGSD
ncbi:uncharacterized protein [Heterodontus francisci]|uniref:uncharacterized protein n=1 Tax=Heterodontus francisci TaxID=7792 RepID=UPI00355B3202